MWRSTTDLRPGECGLCPHQQPPVTASIYGAPFWRGNGDDIDIQNAIHQCCPGSGTKLQRDFLGRVNFNNFRALIFRLIEKVDHSFILAPVMPHEGDELGKRILMTEHLIRFLNVTGLKRIKVCALKGMRENWQYQSKVADNLSRQAQILESNVLNWLKKTNDCTESSVTFLPERNDDGTPLSGQMDLDFEVEHTIYSADLIVPYDGSTGNLLARTLTYLAKDIEVYAIPWFILDKHNPWPIGEGAFIGYCWPHRDTPLKKAAMWNILGGHHSVQSRTE